MLENIVNKQFLRVWKWGIEQQRGRERVVVRAKNCKYTLRLKSYLEEHNRKIESVKLKVKRERVWKKTLKKKEDKKKRLIK